METTTMNNATMNNTQGNFFSGLDVKSFAVGFGAGVATAGAVYGTVKLTKMAINRHREKALEKQFNEVVVVDDDDLFEERKPN